MGTSTSPLIQLLLRQPPGSAAFLQASTPSLLSVILLNRSTAIPTFNKEPSRGVFSSSSSFLHKNQVNETTYHTRLSFLKQFSFDAINKSAVTPESVSTAAISSSPTTRLFCPSILALRAFFFPSFLLPGKPSICSPYKVREYPGGRKNYQDNMEMTPEIKAELGKPGISTETKPVPTLVSDSGMDRAALLRRRKLAAAAAAATAASSTGTPSTGDFNSSANSTAGSASISSSSANSLSLEDLQMTGDLNASFATRTVSSSPLGVGNNSNDGTMKMDSESEQFPYPLTSTVTVRWFKSTESSRLLVSCSVVSYLWYLAHWFICTLAVPILAYWLGSLFVRTGLYLSSSDGSLELPSLWRFFGDCGRFTIELSEFCVSIVSSILKSIRSADVNRLVVSMKSIYNDFPSLEFMKKMPMFDVSCLTYFALASYISFQEFVWIPMTKRGSSLPRFVKTSDADLPFFSKIGAAFFNMCLHWYLPGGAVLFEDYEAFINSGRQTGRAKNPPTLICYHPHGVVSNLLGLLTAFPELDGYNVMAAPLMKAAGPLFSIFRFGYTRLSSADKKTFRSSMERTEGMVLVPGGIQEATLTKRGEERLYIFKRKGFIREALIHGYSLTPVYGFGENLMYDNYGADLFSEIKEKANRKGLISALLIGKWCTPLPHRVPPLVVVGEPLKLPKIENPSKDDVNEYHKKYVERLSRLYARYADSYYAYVKNRGDVDLPKRKDGLGERKGGTELVPQGKHAPPLVAW